MYPKMNSITWDTPNIKAGREDMPMTWLAKWLNWNKLSKSTKLQRLSAKCTSLANLLKFIALKRTDLWPKLSSTSSAPSTALRMDTNGTAVWKDWFKLLNTELEPTKLDKLMPANP